VVRHNEAGMSPTENVELILASKSPRRKQLLEQAGLTFAVIPADFDEDGVPFTEPESYVKTLAVQKSRQIAKTRPHSWVIGADTIVCIDDLVLGKPRDREDARRMLKRLSNRTHQVFTGFALMCIASDICIAKAVKTDVRFKALTEAEIEWYIHTREPFDKAGAYAIQGLGTFLVSGVIGSYTNVVGLPVCELIDMLAKQGVIRPGPGERWV
jgi:septum formation protein